MTAAPAAATFIVFLQLFAGLPAQGAGDAKTPPPAGMVQVDGGEYTPLYSKGAKPRRAPACYLDVTPVTNGQFLAFVSKHPEWQRSKVTAAQADDHYLRHWAGDLDLGPRADQLVNAPVTNVSWFAARAYCASLGRRLPSHDEWEFAARADATRIDASMDPAFQRKLLDWYSQPGTGALISVEKAEANVYGLRGLHGLVWEWVHDFNSTMITGDSRGDDSLERKLFCGAASLLASDVSNYGAFMRYAFRSSLKGNYCVGTLGFRTALTPGQPPLPVSAGRAQGVSPFDVAGPWRTQNNEEIVLPDLKGKVRVLTMGFTSCQYSCPRIVGDLQRIESALGADALKVGFVFISIDPVRDTPERMARFAAERKLDPARWTMLSGSAERVRELAVTMAYKYQQAGEDFAHSNLIAVIDASGAIVHREDALGADIAPSVAAVRKSLTAR